MKVLCTAQTGGTTALGQTMRVVAMARALRSKGHQVKVLAEDKIIGVIKQNGLDVVEMPAIPASNIQYRNLTGLDKSSREELMANMKKHIGLISEAEKKIIEIEKPDVLLCGNFTGPLSARTFGIPSVMTVLQPHGQQTVEFFTKQLSKSETIEKYMKDVIDAANLLIVEGMPELGGEVIEEAGANWQALKDKVRYVGPLMAESPDNLPGQEELKIRHAGSKEKPLVYVTIGGGTPLIGEDFLSLILEMFRALPNVNGVVSTGLAVDPNRLAGNPPGNISIFDFVPGTELIKASDVTVFHGGSSTLMTCIACGRPGIVIPSMAEQADNGAVLVNNQAGIVLEKEGLSASGLAEAVNTILNNDSYRTHALNLKELGEKYGGASKAASMVEELVRGVKL